MYSVIFIEYIKRGKKITGEHYVALLLLNRLNEKLPTFNEEKNNFSPTMRRFIHRQIQRLGSWLNIVEVSAILS